MELGASAIDGVFYFAIYMIGFGFSQGAQILIEGLIKASIPVIKIVAFANLVFT